LEPEGELGIIITVIRWNDEFNVLDGKYKKK